MPHSPVRPIGFIEPCLPSIARKPPNGPQWLHEIKHDGYRLMARRDGDTHHEIGGSKLLGGRSGHARGNDIGAIFMSERRIAQLTGRVLGGLLTCTMVLSALAY
jgi:ATP-dependent DNA ligase